MDPDVPIVRGWLKNRFYLTLSSGRRKRIKYCFWCGCCPRQTCVCGAPAAWAAEPVNPVYYDGASGAFRLAHAKGALRLHYCPACGGALPASQSSEEG
jgi:hypothetical protein